MTPYARLASYHDLASDHGPLHAKAVADTGRRYLADLPLLPYQSFPTAAFRAELDGEPGVPHVVVRDPRDLPRPLRGAAWRRLCADLDAWRQLDTSRRLVVSTVLARLGFWSALAVLPLPDAPPARDAPRLVHRLCVARRKSARGGPEVTHLLREALRAQAANDSLALPARLGAAVNLLVEHARSGGAADALAHWQSVSQGLVERAAPGTYSDLLLSAYWRGVSFVPFHGGDHGRVREMLDASERLARTALRTAGPERLLLARENHRLVLMTRARAAQADGRAEEAEQYLRAAVRADPQDPVSSVQLADHLVLAGRLREAGESYLRAASLGAPCTAYARGQAANCRTSRQ